MDPNPKSAKQKIAFTGTNSSGKTTMAMEVCARLKRDHHVLAELVSSQDRKITWKDDHFPVDPRAHYGMITNLIHAEVQAELKGDANVVITDRSVLDLYAIALTDHPDSTMIKALWQMVLAWSKTYTRIYFLKPLSYQEDGKRPSDEFRMKTFDTLERLLDFHKLPNVIRLERHEIFSDIREVLAVPKANDILYETQKWQFVADTFGVKLVVKHRTTSTSDVDVWFDPSPLIREDDFDPEGIEYAVKTVNNFLKQLFGTQVVIDLMLSPPVEESMIPFEHTTYTPKEG